MDTQVERQAETSMIVRERRRKIPQGEPLGRTEVVAESEQQFWNHLEKRKTVTPRPSLVP